MSLPERAEQMLHRLGAAARRAGAGERGTLVVTAARLAIAARSPTLDERDPALLHPARSALVLLEDVRDRDPVTAAAASLVESLDTELEVSGDRIRAGLGAETAAQSGEAEARSEGAAASQAAITTLGPAAAALAISVPTPAREGDRLLESLLAADHAARLAALAERLDHARHLHLRASEGWLAFHDSAVAVYLPVARRTDDVLAGRFQWWADMFARRYLSGA